MSASLRMFGSLWNAVAAHEHRRQDGSRRRYVCILRMPLVADGANLSESFYSSHREMLISTTR